LEVLDVADNNMVKIALIGGAAYLAYRQGWLSFLGVGTPKSVSSAPSVPTPAPDPNAITGANTVAGVQARTIAAAKAPSTGLSIDEWGYFLNNVLAPLGKQAPDPMPLFSAVAPGFDRSQVITSGQYWAVMAPALKSQLGLTGLGLYWVVG
jgi:hypothetical protein